MTPKAVIEYRGKIGMRWSRQVGILEAGHEVAVLNMPASVRGV